MRRDLYKILKLKTSMFLISTTLTLTSCSEKVNDHYSGIIEDELGRPLEGVLVIEDYLDHTETKCTTDINGFFKYKWVGTSEIILSKEGYLNDTIKLMWHQHGEITEYAEIVKRDSSILVLKEDK